MIIFVIDYFLPGIVGGIVAYRMAKRRGGVGFLLLVLLAAIGSGIATQAVLRVVSLVSPYATPGFVFMIVLRGFGWGLVGGLIGLPLGWWRRRRMTSKQTASQNTATP